MSILKTIALGVFVIVSLLPSYTHSDQIPVANKVVLEEILSPIGYADKYALQYGVDANVLKKVMWCESGNKPNAVGDGGKARNVMQFHEPTFLHYEKELGKDLDYNSYKDQIELAAFMFSIKQQGHWTCYKMVIGR